jgi:hypothetical protein
MSEAIRQRCRIDYGATRAVLLLGRYAFKVPFAFSWKHFLLGLIANMQEVSFSRAGWPELAPVVAHLPGGLLVVMRRCEPLTEEQWAAFEPSIANGWLVGDDYYVPAEPKQSSYGFLNGRIVALDYGN